MMEAVNVWPIIPYAVTPDVVVLQEYTVFDKWWTFDEMEETMYLIVMFRGRKVTFRKRFDEKVWRLCR